MSFKDIETFLKKSLESSHAPTPDDAKTRIHEECMAALAEKREQAKAPWWEKPKLFFKQRGILIGLGVSILLLVQLLSTTFFVRSGKIYPVNGLVEINRDGKNYLVQKPFSLHTGDIVQVRSSAKATVSFPGKLESEIGDNTQFRVIDHGALYVQKGSIISTLFMDGNITTNRGIIRSDEKAVFQITVSETGETAVFAQESSVSVFDWNNGEQVLQAGEEIRLRTDTVLSDFSVPEDLTLSLDQMLAIRSKLAISRTKAVRGLEHKAVGKKEEAESSFAGAHKTYRSIIQVLDSSRDLSFIARKNIDTVTRDQVVLRMKEKGVDAVLIEEARALEILFVLYEEEGETSFNEEFTGVSSFDRYRLVDRLFAGGTIAEQALGEVLKQRYIIAFLQDIQNEVLVVDQTAKLNEAFDLLPNTETTTLFLNGVKERFDPILKKALEERQEELVE